MSVSAPPEPGGRWTDQIDISAVRGPRDGSKSRIRRRSQEKGRARGRGEVSLCLVISFDPPLHFIEGGRWPRRWWSLGHAGGNFGLTFFCFRVAPRYCSCLSVPVCISCRAVLCCAMPFCSVLICFEGVQLRLVLVVRLSGFCPCRSPTLSIPVRAVLWWRSSHSPPMCRHLTCQSVNFRFLSISQSFASW